LIFGVALGMLLAFVAGFLTGLHAVFGLRGDDDDPLTLSRTAKSAPAKKFFPGEPDEPVYEGPNWDLPGVER